MFLSGNSVIKFRLNQFAFLHIIFLFILLNNYICINYFESQTKAICPLSALFKLRFEFFIFHNNTSFFIQKTTLYTELSTTSHASPNKHPHMLPTSPLHPQLDIQSPRSQTTVSIVLLFPRPNSFYVLLPQTNMKHHQGSLL